MPDITMCKGKDCPLKNNCYRHTVKPSVIHQSYFIEEPYDKKKKNCECFWKDKK